MSDDMGEPDIQRFDSDGTWVKPPGAVRLAVSLKGGEGDNSVGAIPHAVTFIGGGGGYVHDGSGGGSGGSSAASGAAVVGAGGGAGGSSAVAMDMRTVARAPECNVTPGHDGQLVEFAFTADEVPDRMDIKIGRGGYAEITTYLMSDEDRDLWVPVNKLIRRLNEAPGQHFALTYDEAEDIVELVASEWGPLEGYTSRQEREDA